MYFKKDETFIKNAARVEYRLNIQDCPVYEETTGKMGAFTYLLQSKEGTVLKYGAVLIIKTFNWVAHLKRRPY